MARRKRQIQESLRWPNAFANPEALQLLVAREEWKLLVKDLALLHQDLSYRLGHEIVVSMEQAAQQNFQRGQLAGIERIIEFEQELSEWREDHKG